MAENAGYLGGTEMKMIQRQNDGWTQQSQREDGLVFLSLCWQVESVNDCTYRPKSQYQRRAYTLAELDGFKQSTWKEREYLD